MVEVPSQNPLNINVFNFSVCKGGSVKDIYDSF